MMNIGFVISGNLTGFSRFYANDEAKQLLNSTKFNFDVHNLVSFLNDGEKLYAIFFSKDVVAVSLITNILDSFRRPGNLVVTVLIPRGFKITDGFPLSGATALYNLLNELNDKFYERNFLNGMVNQNPAVLMQDYYTGILSKFRLEPDLSQRMINRLIDETTPNKKNGYISALERSIPSYLSSIFRKSYEGYHHIFFASNAPQNIDEPAEEIVTYKVRVSNDNRSIYGEVRLDDRIPDVSPQQGEMPIPNQNYTYIQVLNGEAGNEIIGSIENDTIVLTYHFQEEEKTIYFKFYEGANEVPLHVIRPIIIESNGSDYPLSTDCWTFRGKEIYGLKNIRSGNSDYTIESRSTQFDPQRIREGATHYVYVEKVWIWYFNPVDDKTKGPIKPITITLINEYRDEQRQLKNITGATSERLSGSPEEWKMRVDSDYYESFCVPITSQFEFKPKKQPLPSTKENGRIGDRTYIQRGGSGSRTQGNSVQQIKLFGGANDTAKEQTRIEAEKKKRLIQYGIYAVVAIICCVGGWWGYTVWNKDKVKEEVVTPDATWVTKNVIFSLEDGSANLPQIEKENLALLDFTVVSNWAKIEDGDNVYSKVITYNPHNDNDTIIIKVTFNKIGEGLPLTFAFERFTVNELSEGINSVVLSVKNSELTSFRELEAGNIPAGLSSQITRLSDGNKDMRTYALHLVNLKNKIEKKNDIEESNAKEAKAKADAKAKAEAARAEAERKAQQSETETTGYGEIRKGLDDAGISLSKLNDIKPQNDAEKDRIKALRSVLRNLLKGECPENSNNLSRTQKQIVDQLISRYKELKALPDTDTEKQNKLAAFSNGLKAKNNGVNSIFTAREALKVKP